MTVEAELARRGWVAANGPGNASLLIVCGTPGSELDTAVRTFWDSLANPRAHVALPGGATRNEVAHALDGGAARLSDSRAQQRDAAVRGPEPDPGTPGMDRPHHDPHAGHGTHDGDGHTEHADHGDHGDRGDMEHSGHEHHMGNPGGLPMAGRGADRDGLKLDRLHVPLGPLLPDWPSGLVVETTMQGDVIQQAAARPVEGAAHGISFWDEPWILSDQGHPVTRGEAERRRAAAHLDSMGRLFAVAGWPAAGARARGLRDRVLAGESRTPLVAAYAPFARQVRRSLVLRWMLRGVNAGESDVLSRLEYWLARTGEALDALDDRSRPGDDQGPRHDQPSLAALSGLLVGVELAAARLIVAALDLDLERAQAQVAHG
ncbi:hypothetical protein [Nonomuraea diastatica]|uniref:Uncharacterized protein n=1 Tax=Nonomuraea diastatica TaxID=1848329 RepID=A0A4R4WUZ9_9ACTN|nr:hypothetical protein [Nonomuraea diastatica]TDD21491.1 hypothetical protein E1294_14550 [Nonomuraea diastatica]